MHFDVSTGHAAPGLGAATGPGSWVARSTAASPSAAAPKSTRAVSGRIAEIRGNRRRSLPAGLHIRSKLPGRRA